MKSFVAIVHTIAERWFDHYAVYYISCDYTDEEDLQRLETRFRVHEFSKTFDGPNHAIACRIVSPCSSTVLMPAGLRYPAVRKRDKGTSTEVPFYSEPSGTFFHRTFSARAGPSSDRQQLLIGGSTVMDLPFHQHLLVLLEILKLLLLLYLVIPQKVKINAPFTWSLLLLMHLLPMYKLQLMTIVLC